MSCAEMTDAARRRSACANLDAASISGDLIGIQSDFSKEFCCPLFAFSYPLKILLRVSINVMIKLKVQNISGRDLRFN